MCAFLTVDGSYLIWLIYGNVIFYSKENNCESIENSQTMYKIMLMLLIVGYFQMAVYLLLIILIPILFFAQR